MAMQINYDDVVRAEKEAMRTMGWQLMKVTHRQVIECFKCLGVVFDKEECGDIKKLNQTIDEMCELAS